MLEALNICFCIHVQFTPGIFFGTAPVRQTSIGQFRVSFLTGLSSLQVLPHLIHSSDFNAGSIPASRVMTSVLEYHVQLGSGISPAGY